ncbi:similar to Saccharomyces cerevisiae YBR153W RIB7 Diaminohydroxyphoshoribosylaminopyrimidine deaminase [Maudiozyma barnettii]|uniref:2,5-diamino-6-ribosylamino-4(3H)-pyrimidinone 5'-phosphate reductase n=1 Tax=Maudiozyma barnettii TaxID=61262 RepID=A0A8H2VDQ0_9SACH|nr:2,5-diamino-6-(ribosylamino)-4(3H)-pyrimidinone 5'-phosphate reductase [Kazachstania barnettii]CAB4253620.1 similar to Saccharomyces cerevisiae YBR153W RIB7 Diaminohydroxyphoshoribosylaminopyrimidine deaminase [Kazachstania barnettii]CAD1781296.1 similar to Saccharomyces cerevisiae YBR153W RIB7 Diaminohydroxyphoshoribosylaminopyrimidine deaminase [Kazachstania barnettii]
MSLDPIRQDLIPFLASYLPPEQHNIENKPFVTLTYAQSIDARISLGPGIRTSISDVETKVMTHYLRYHHDGILIGSGTVLADDPGLNCKWHPDVAESKLSEYSPRPIILDPSQKWRFIGSKMYDLFKNGEGKSPIIVVSEKPQVEEEYIDYLIIDGHQGRIDWKTLVDRLSNEFGIKSIMVEGGAFVINELLLRDDIVDSLIVTVGSTYLGEDGVQVSPKKAISLIDADWWKGKKDSIMAARLVPRTN